MKTNWNGKRIVMLGAARQGQALVRYMAAHGAKVTLSDSKSMDELASAREALRDLPIQWVVGGHPLSLLDQADLICVTGGADLRMPILREAQKRGIPVLNDTEIFLDEVSAPVIGITGSSGKTTTTTLVGRIAEHAKKDGQRVWVGGNIGTPLLTMVDQIQPSDIVILELSSFQLELTTVSPAVAALLNITPNHLDRHGTMDAYIRAKKHILEFQSAADWSVLNREDANAWALRAEIHGKLISFGNAKADGAEAQVWFDGNQVMLRWNGVETPVIRQDQIALRGAHNLYNVMAAIAIAAAAGFSAEAMAQGIAGFSGVDHRLQFVRHFGGADWYNDSIATAPERTLAALHSFTEPLILLLGGRDKKLPWDTLAQEIHQCARAAVLFGEAGELIESALRENAPAGSRLQVERTDSLENAVAIAAKCCQQGDVVLLSPGGTSYDAFRDFEERGKAYTEWVMQLK